MEEDEGFVRRERKVSHKSVPLIHSTSKLDLM
jgi:hypothetical protein